MTSWVLSCNRILYDFAYMSQWATPEGEEPGKVHSQKVKVNFLPPDGHPLDEEDEFPHRMSMMSGVAPEEAVSRHHSISCQPPTFSVALVRHREGKTQYVWTSWRSVLGHP